MELELESGIGDFELESGIGDFELESGAITPRLVWRHSLAALVNCGHERRNRAPAFIWAIAASIAPLGNR